jgi:hypothetical protein
VATLNKFPNRHEVPENFEYLLLLKQKMHCIRKRVFKSLKYMLSCREKKEKEDFCLKKRTIFKIKDKMLKKRKKRKKRTSGTPDDVINIGRHVKILMTS